MLTTASIKSTLPERTCVTIRPRVPPPQPLLPGATTAGAGVGNVARAAIAAGAGTAAGANATTGAAIVGTDAAAKAAVGAAGKAEVRRGEAQLLPSTLQLVHKLPKVPP